MAAYTLKVRRYQPEATDDDKRGAFWETFDVDLDPTLSVLDGLLQARNDQDGTLAVRCSCRAAICGSCGVKVNGQSTLACKTQLGHAAAEAERMAGVGPAAHGREAEDAAGVILVEPMGNMPVIKDLVTDMESTHWEKYRRVTPWLLPTGPPPEREYIVPAEAMVDVTQSVACIQCGACVSACLSMEADPDFIGPAALAKAYRFVGDPRDGQTTERLFDLANDPHGIYDCTHCFACIEACPKGVAPMNQIMRLRRLAGHDHDVDDVNNGRRHELAFVKIIKSKGTLDESLLLQESFAPGIISKLKPTIASIKGLLESIPTAIRGIRTGKMRSVPKLIPGVHHKLPGDSQDHVKRIYETAEESRIELNLFVIGEGGEEEHLPGQEGPAANITSAAQAEEVS
ncbi:MAG: succinate dehydrogenase/fumarate reductase iron-sulfur subunit [Solirubrobacterales bacterium]